MRIYMLMGDVTIHNVFAPEVKTETTKALGFVRSEKQARLAVKHLIEYTESIDNIYWEKEDVPSDKEGFIKWLNDFCWQEENVQDLINEILEEV